MHFRFDTFTVKPKIQESINHRKFCLRRNYLLGLHIFLLQSVKDAHKVNYFQSCFQLLLQTRSSVFRVIFLLSDLYMTLCGDLNFWMVKRIHRMNTLSILRHKLNSLEKEYIVQFRNRFLPF